MQELPPVRILLVEDNPGDVRLIREMFTEAGDARFELLCAETLAGAQRHLEERGADLVFLDLSLPDSQGLDTFHRLSTAASDTPVVVLTGLDDRRVALDAVRRGAQDYLVKGRVDAELLARAAQYALERSASAAALRESQRLAQGTLDALNAHIAILDAAGTILAVNRRWRTFAEKNGLHRDLVGENYLSVCDRAQGEGAEEAAQAAAGIRSVAAGGAEEFTLEYACHGPGVRRWFRLRVTGCAEAAGRVAVAHEDVTESRLAQAALAASEARYRNLVDLSPDAVVTRIRGRIAFANPEAVRLLGASGADALLGQPVVRFIHPDDREALLERIGKTEEQGLAFHAEEQRVIGLDGRIRTVEASGVPFAEGEDPGALVILRDISERKELQAQLHQAQKMEAVGRLAGGVAHDFNNLLQIILGSTELLLEEEDPESPMGRRIMDVRRAGERARSLTGQLLAFSRRQAVAPIILSLNPVVAETEKMLRRLIGEDVVLTTALAPDLAPVRVDPGQVGQILLNLAVNARDAMPGGGQLAIETQNVDLDAAYAADHPTVTPGPHVLLAVSDTGCGMSADTLGHLFEPFFTTKALGQGTGLGLATVYGIVKQAGGHIWVYSEVGHGTVFKVYFPRAAGRVAAPCQLVGEAPSGGTETVLVAEDEAAVRDLVGSLLTRRGYTVLMASTPGEALRMATAHPGPIHVLLTDVVMPGMGGRQLAEAFLAARPETRVVYMSGYLDDAIVRHGVLEPGIHFLQKPFNPLALARKVREALDP